MERTKIKPKLASGFMVLIFIVGFIGFNSPVTVELFKTIVPFQLLLTAIILFYFHDNWNKNFIIWSLFTLFTGFIIELIGVKTSLIFGAYSYGNTLGFKLFDIPIMIAINWLVLSYCTAIISEKFAKNIFLKSIIGAFLMVFIDYFIEPVAIKYDYWSWKSINVPLQNYLAWFIISLIIIFLFHLKIKVNNPLALPIYLMQLMFFISFSLVQLFVFS